MIGRSWGFLPSCRTSSCGSTCTTPFAGGWFSSTVLGKQLGLLPEQAALVGRVGHGNSPGDGICFSSQAMFIKSTWPAKDFGLTVERSCWALCLISPSWSWSELLLLSLFWQLENPTLVVIQGFCTQYFWRVGRPTPMNVWPLTHVATGKWTSSISTLPVRRGTRTARQLGRPGCPQED